MYWNPLKYCRCEMGFRLGVPEFMKNNRYTLGVANLLFLVSGVYLMLVGVAVRVVYSEYDVFLSQRFFALPNVLIATGIMAIAFSVPGFYGAISENFYILCSYVFLLCVVLMMQIIISAQGNSLRSDATSEIRQTMAPTLLQYTSRLEIAKIWDDLQMQYECCGVAGWSDWFNSLGGIPVSCCYVDYGAVSPFECTRNNAYSTSCAPTLAAELSTHATLMMYSGVATLALQLAIMTVAVWVTWRSKYEEVELES